MFSHTIHESVRKRVYFDWFLLSFLAGHVNAGGFLACERFVTHVTGFATLAGVALFKSGIMPALAILSVPLYFLLGVMLSAYLTERKLAHRVHGNRYAPVMGLVATLLAAVAIFGYFDFFGTFGDTVILHQDYVLLALLCGASGLQNAAITSSSGATVRTTHLTGITTDLGLGIIRHRLGKLDAPAKEREYKANKLRAATIGSFILGSFVGAFCYVQWSYLGFLVPAAIALWTANEARREGAVGRRVPPPAKEKKPRMRAPSEEVQSR